MTKKDYEVIAQSIRNRLITVSNNGSYTNSQKLASTSEIILLADKLATALKDENPRFDYDKFTEACGFHGTNTIDYRN